MPEITKTDLLQIKRLLNQSAETIERLAVKPKDADLARGCRILVKKLNKK